MIDRKKIKKAASAYEKKTQIECKKLNEKLNRGNGFSVTYKSADAAFIDGAKWAIREFSKGLTHSATEIPRNDNGKILAFSKVNRNIKLYDMNDSLDETICDTYKEMWENEIKTYSFTDWVFIEDLIDLINKIV